MAASAVAWSGAPSLGVVDASAVAPTSAVASALVVASPASAAPSELAAPPSGGGAPWHVPVLASQSGVAPEHSLALVAEHWAQAPPGWQAGVAPPHSPSASQMRQLWLVGSHTGWAAAHCPSTRQLTHSPDAASHRGVVPAQADVSAAEHWPQAPLGWQAGVAPPHWASAAQPWQVCAWRSQTGAVAPH